MHLLIGLAGLTGNLEGAGLDRLRATTRWILEPVSKVKVEWGRGWVNIALESIWRWKLGATKECKVGGDQERGLSVQRLTEVEGSGKEAGGRNVYQWSSAGSDGKPKTRVKRHSVLSNKVWNWGIISWYLAISGWSRIQISSILLLHHPTRVASTSWTKMAA